MKDERLIREMVNLFSKKNGVSKKDAILTLMTTALAAGEEEIAENFLSFYDKIVPPLPEGEFRRNFETLLDDVQEQFLSAKADGVELEIPGDMNADMRESIKNILSMAELMYKGGGAPCVERMLKRFFLRGVLK